VGDTDVMTGPAFVEELPDDGGPLDQLAAGVADHGRVILARRGRPFAVVVPVEELASLEETAALAADPEAQRRLGDSVAAARAGDTVTGDELRAEFGLPAR